ncbi:hypothetical protein RhiirB3_455480 [Rhizophagus irregularis]|nr:hypothetical protein RhiirB3_455480 [Rhizophagus irregularis]
MANIIDFRFKVHDKSDDEIFIIKIAWQTLVKVAIPTIKKGMATLYKQVPDEIKLYVDNPKGPAKALEQDDMISKHFNIDHIEEEMLHRNKVNGEDITSIKQFTPVFEEINDDDKAFGHCMDDIILKLSNVESMTDANEATRCEFISAILHASIAIAKNLTSQDIFIVLQKDISGEDATGRVDYTIKSLEEFLCITEGNHNLAQLESAFQTNKKKRTADQAFNEDYFDYLYGIVTTGAEWHFIIYTHDGIYCTSGSEYQINLTKSAIKENPELLRSNVKRVIGIIVGLLKDRVSIDSSPASKRARIKKIIKK